MSPLLTIISTFPGLSFPPNFLGWFGLVICAALLGITLWYTRKLNRPMTQGRWLLLIGLLIASLPASLFFGFRFVQSEVSPPPGLSAIAIEPVSMVLSAVPWVLAAGLIGPNAAAAAGFLSGLLLGYWNTHTIYTSFELALLAAAFSACVRQRYRTRFFGLLRHPIGAAVIISLVYSANHFFVLLVLSNGYSLQRLDYTFRNLSNAALGVSIPLFTAAVIAELILLLAPRHWIEPAPLVPSPSERSLQMRFSQKMAPFAVILLIILVLGDWIIAGSAAREMIEEQMASAARLTSSGFPLFRDVGQNLISQLANDPALLSDQPVEVAQALSKDIKFIPFFNQLTVIDTENQVIGSYPTSYYVGNQSPLDELLGIQLIADGPAVQIYTIPPAEAQETAQFSFLAPILNQDGTIRRVLIGRSDLNTNPFAASVMSGLKGLPGDDDIGILIDKNQKILYHPIPSQIMTVYTGQLPQTPGSFEETLNGQRMLVLVEPVIGTDYSFILMVPVYRAQESALEIATPMLVMIALLTLLIFIGLRYGLKSVTDSLNSLAKEAGRIAQGKLNQPLAVESLDEVGELRRAFEQMRVSLKERLTELNRLLQVSQGVASSLDISEAVQPVLEAALSSGASSARVVLASHDNHPGSLVSQPLGFGYGISQNLYRDLDEQILNLTQQMDRLVLSNLRRPRLLNIAPGAPVPESLMAVSLRHENQFYGALWIAYEQPHIFSEEEVRFMVTLGGQAALAAVNARLFLTAEIGRQRMESILASSPDAILVTDQLDQLLLANPAAWQVLGLNMEEINRGQPINQIIKEPELLKLLSSANTRKQSVEVAMPGGRTYVATATPVSAEGQRVGRVCTLRDITHFKEVDALKSEFVATVSHDLRSPLTLMRGYATMLDMVGQLNDQQSNYVQKIILGVENMSRMVNNLLDLGRIESGVGLQLEMVDVKEIIENMINSFQIQATQKRIQLSADIPEDKLPAIQADHALLKQALENLVENGIHFTRPEGKVLIRIRVQPSNVVFEVIDNGVGISPVDQPHLFEKFFRGGQQTAKDQSGTGLGLAIVRSIAEKHGGRVWADSQLGKGSTFYLTIPINQGLVDEVQI